jgi:hypothetical protein
VEAIERRDGPRDAADRALVLTLADTVRAARFTVQELWRHARTDAELHAAIAAADLTSPQQVGKWLRRVEGVEVQGRLVVRERRTRARRALVGEAATVVTVIDTLSRGSTMAPMDTTPRLHEYTDERRAHIHSMNHARWVQTLFACNNSVLAATVTKDRARSLLMRYFDASALVKRYVRETGSVTVRRLSHPMYQLRAGCRPSRSHPT